MTTAGDIEEVVEKRIWDPVEAWKELNFTVFPEGDPEFETVSQNSKPGTAPFETIRGIQRLACRKHILQWSPVVVNLKEECKLRGFYLLHPEFYYSRTNLTRKPVPRGIFNRLL